MNYSKRHLIHYFRPPDPVLVDWPACDRRLGLSIKRDCYFMGGDTMRDEPEPAGPRFAPLDRLIVETNGIDCIQWIRKRKDIPVDEIPRSLRTAVEAVAPPVVSQCIISKVQ
jgi:hypothetical protein